MRAARRKVGVAKQCNALIALAALFSLNSFVLADAFSNRRRLPPFLPPLRGGMASRRPTAIPKKSEAASLLPDLVAVRSPRGGGGSGPAPLDMSPADAAEVVFDNSPLFQSLAVICGTNVLGALLSFASGSFLHVDLLGAGAFGLATVPVLAKAGAAVKGAALSGRVKLSCAAVAVWSARLAAFLFARAVEAGHDARVSWLLETAGGTVVFWISSAIWGVVCSLPHTLGTTSSAPGSPAALAAGSALFAAGFVVEALADHQKRTFKAANPGKFCDVGLWSVSQHPNFFGNLVLWAGILIMNAPALVEPAPADGGGAGIWDAVWGCRRLGLAALSLLSMWGWFHGQADGTLTSAVELATKKYGDDAAYVEYVEKVPLIIPDLFGWGK